MESKTMKKTIPIKPFWYSDVLVLPKIVTIVTTVNEKGVINAAPYSLFLPYNVMNRTPQVLLGMRKFSHTYKNILSTREFVVNFPTVEYLDDVMETSRFYAEGVNELDNTKFTPVKSSKVSPPNLKECPQHIECKLFKNYEIDKTQAQVIGDVVSIDVDEGLIDIDRGEKIINLKLPIYMGDEKRKYFYYCKADSPEMIELKPPPKTERGKEKIKTKLEWEKKALQALNEIPSYVRTMVVEMTEDIVQKEGVNKVTHDRFVRLIKEYAPKDVLERFETE